MRLVVRPHAHRLHIAWRSCARAHAAAVPQMQEKQRKKLHQVAALEAREAYKSMLRERREQHEAAKQKKEDNRKSNDAKHGVALSSAAAKKMLKNKKLRKQVVVA